MVCAVCGESFTRWDRSYSDPIGGPKYWKTVVDAQSKPHVLPFCSPHCSLKWEQDNPKTSPKK